MARELTLVRLPEFCHATPGVLYLNKAPTFLTIEPPWLDNASNVSCVPPGRYKIELVNSPAFGETWELKGVPNRSEILIHWGNTPEDTEGCVLIGESWGWIDPYFAVLNSRKALKRLSALLGREEAFMTITEANICLD